MDELEALKRVIEALPPRERAAAIAHAVYVATAQRDPDWALRVASRWDTLDTKARDFNLSSIDTWAAHPALLAMWVDAVNAVQRQRTPG